MTVTLYYMSGSPYAWRAWLALMHKGIEFTLRTMSYDAGDFRSEEFLKTIVPPRIRIDDTPAHKLRCVGEAHIVHPDRNHKPAILESRCHDTADREFLLYAWLVRIPSEDNDLLPRFLSQHPVDLVPEVITATKPLLIHPDPIGHGR